MKEKIVLIMFDKSDYMTFPQGHMYLEFSGAAKILALIQPELDAKDKRIAELEAQVATAKKEGRRTQWSGA